MVVKDYGEYDIIGQTRDDAAGEAFDKVARAIGLGYPGGPKIDKAAREGNPDAFTFPQAKIEGAEYDFSFSGLKSAVLNLINQAKMQGQELSQADVAASFQKSVVEVLAGHAIRACKEYGYDKLAIELHPTPRSVSFWKKSARQIISNFTGQVLFYVLTTQQ